MRCWVVSVVDEDDNIPTSEPHTAFIGDRAELRALAFAEQLHRENPNWNMGVTEIPVDEGS